MILSKMYVPYVNNSYVSYENYGVITVFFSQAVSKNSGGDALAAAAAEVPAEIQTSLH